jgi:hypothetical protein
MNVETHFNELFTKLQDKQSKINNGEVHVIVLNDGTLHGNVFDSWHYWVLNSYRSIDLTTIEVGQWNYGKTISKQYDIFDVGLSFEFLFFLTKK